MLYTLVSKPCSEATNKDYFISRGLCFGWRNKIRILMLERFEGGFRRLLSFQTSSKAINQSKFPVHKKVVT